MKSILSKLVCDKLIKNRLIEDIKPGNKIIHLTFINGLREYWDIYGNYKRIDFKLPPSNFFGGNIPVLKEFESRPFDDEREKIIQPHFLLRQRDFQQSGFCKVRLKVHELVQKISEEGWIDFDYPEEELALDLKRLKNPKRIHKMTRVYYNAFISHGSRQMPGRVLTEHFFPDLYNRGERQQLSHCWTSNLTIRRSIDRIIDNRHNVTRLNIIKSIRSVRHFSPSFISPSFYREVIEDLLGNVSSIYDVDVQHDFASKMLAAYLLGAEYHAMDMSKSLRDMSEHVKLGCHISTKCCDVVMLSSITPLGYEEAKKRLILYRNFGKRAIIMVKHSDLLSLSKFMKPLKILGYFRLPLQAKARRLDHILLY